MHIDNKYLHIYIHRERAVYMIHCLAVTATKKGPQKVNTEVNRVGSGVLTPAVPCCLFRSPLLWGHDEPNCTKTNNPNPLRLSPHIPDLFEPFFAGYGVLRVFRICVSLEASSCCSRRIACIC